ncbi:hypothetical protein FHG87_009263 [Trinorchestia longiramus]|nr:hypothetical protein FHG87_009263 [Trinorchestia longiramus]
MVKAVLNFKCNRGVEETVEHLVLECSKYEQERESLMDVVHEQCGENKWNARCVEEDSVENDVHACCSKEWKAAIDYVRVNSKARRHVREINVYEYEFEIYTGHQMLVLNQLMMSGSI